MQQIKIDSVSQDAMQFGTKITLVSNNRKYGFFDKKKDGSHIKAYEQFKKYGFGIGDIVQAEVKEEQKEYQGKPYTQRTIIYFGETEGTPDAQFSSSTGGNNEAPIVQYEKPAQTQNFQKLMDRIDLMEQNILKAINPQKVAEAEELGEQPEIKESDLPF